MVGCDKRDTNRLYLQYPRLLVEVASDSTERLDRGEKRLAYQTIETLEEYVIAAQDRIEATVFRRAANWNSELFTRSEQIIKLDSISLALPLSTLYDGVIPAALAP